MHVFLYILLNALMLHNVRYNIGFNKVNIVHILPYLQYINIIKDIESVFPLPKTEPALMQLIGFLYKRENFATRPLSSYIIQRNVVYLR
jgi:hypothetical protein